MITVGLYVLAEFPSGTLFSPIPSPTHDLGAGLYVLRGVNEAAAGMADCLSYQLLTHPGKEGLDKQVHNQTLGIRKAQFHVYEPEDLAILKQAVEAALEVQDQ